MQSDRPIRSSQSHPSIKEVGQSLVELALTFPLLLLILLGVLDLGRLYFAYMTITNASREGARWGAANPTDCTGMKNRAVQEADNNIVVLAQSNVTTSSCSGSIGTPIRVTVSYNFRLLTTYIFGGGTIPLQAFTEMEIFGQ